MHYNHHGSTGTAEATKRFRRQSLTVYPKNMGIFVAFCSFLVLALGPGLQNAYGVYEEEYNRLYDNKDGGHYSSALGSSVIFVGVAQIFITNVLRTIGYRVMHRLGPGPCVFVGGIIMSVGLLSASYSRNVWELCLTQGILFGAGVSLVWVSAASASLSWFSEACSISTGVTRMGPGFGGLLFSQLTRFSLEKSGTGGSLRWLSLTVLVGVTVLSLGIHKKHLEQPQQARKKDLNDTTVPSVRWSRYLEEEVEDFPECDNDSDEQHAACLNSSALLYSQPTSAGKQSVSKHSNDKLSAAVAATQTQLPGVKPKHVRCNSGISAEIKVLGAAGFEVGGYQPSPSKPKKAARISRHVHFAPDIYRKATLNRLESLARSSSLSGRRRNRDSRYPGTQQYGYNNWAQPSRPNAIPLHDSTFELTPALSNSETSGTLRLTDIYRNWKLCLFVLGVGVGQAGWYILLLFMASISVSVGLDVHNAAITLSAVNGASAVGQFAAGYAANTMGPTNALLLFTLLATASNAILFIPNVGLHLLVIYACVCGASIGATDPLASMAIETQYQSYHRSTTILANLIYGCVAFCVLVLAPIARVAIERLAPAEKKGPATKEAKAKAKAEAKNLKNKDNEGEASKPQSSPASKISIKASLPGSKGNDASTKDTTTTTPVKEGKVTKKMLKEAEQELYQLLLKKKQADRNLMDTEASIYDFETSYFESSGNDGNIVHGFEGYLNTGRHERRQMHFSDGDRIFSQSSATFKKAQEARIAASLLDSDSDESVSSHATGMGARPRTIRKNTLVADIAAGGGSTIKHHGGNRQGTPGARGTPTPAGRTTKKIKLSIDASN
ncbi:hypothetical protein IWW48_001259 [Coemansia sp. RSA 1200]|nr:hypothetical protein IWW48_001259 [Coemansia sp. RSA 1200]